jgi:hypothetical protein
VVDYSGEDYPYPESRFVYDHLPKPSGEPRIPANTA